MVKQYPYELFLFTAGGGGQDVSGNFIPQTGNEWVKLGMCRDEVNSKGSQVMVADGTSHVFDSLIQCPKSIRNVHVGAKVQVRSGSEIRVEGTVSRFDPSQMHSRIWV